jgi:hypothetical protein
MTSFRFVATRAATVRPRPDFCVVPNRIAMRFIVAIVTVLALVGCHAGSHAAFVAAPAIHLADCRGPARSLPDSLVHQLPPRTGRMRPDDYWADLALTVPGGFAGVFYDSAHTPILQLVRPDLADTAKAVLAAKLAFPVHRAVVRPARWDFAQLVDWFNYLHPRLPVPSLGDKDEALNRIRFAASSSTARERLIRALEALDLPCDLVVVDPRDFAVSY